MSTEILFDSLPYCDGPVDTCNSQVKALAEAEAMILEEAGLILRNNADYPLFEEREGLRNALISSMSGRKMDAIDVERFKVLGDSKNWKGSAQNAKTQLEYQSNRSNNLDVLSASGGDGWKEANSELESLIKAKDVEIEELNRELRGINKERKQEQLLTQKALAQMKQRQIDLVSSIIQVRNAIESTE